MSKESEATHLTAVCQVCGSPAATHKHYGAICCYSCRIFFKRSKAHKFTCSGGQREEGGCLVDTRTRSKCKKCRYDRCLQAGMDPALADSFVRIKPVWEVEGKVYVSPPTATANAVAGYSGLMKYRDLTEMTGVRGTVPGGQGEKRSKDWKRQTTGGNIAEDRGKWPRKERSETASRYEGCVLPVKKRPLIFEVAYPDAAISKDQRMIMHLSLIHI